MPIARVAGAVSRSRTSDTTIVKTTHHRAEPNLTPAPNPNERQPNPTALSDQNVRDRGHPEGGEGSIGRIASRHPKAGNESATPAASEGATENQEEHRARRRGDGEPDEESEGQRSGHPRSRRPC